MPIYEYKCEKCSHTFEELESINSEIKEKECPKCGSKAQRLISLSSYHLTGSGFYNTDYKNKPAVCPSAEKGGHSCCESCPHAANS